MKWYSMKKYTPYNTMGECMVMTENDDIWLAKFDWHNEDGKCGWIGECGKILDGVTHFCIPEPVEFEE